MMLIEPAHCAKFPDPLAVTAESERVYLKNIRRDALTREVDAPRWNHIASSRGGQQREVR